MSDTPVEVQFTSARCLNYPCRTPAPLIGVQPVDARIYTPADIDHTFDVLVREPNGGLLVLPDTFNTVHRAKIIALAAGHRIPAVYPQRFYATDGGLMAYGAGLVRSSMAAISVVLTESWE